MQTLVVTCKQAEYLADVVSKSQHAQRVANDAIELLTLGHHLEGFVLTNINTNTGVLTFSPREIVHAAE